MNARSRALTGLGKELFLFPKDDDAFDYIVQISRRCFQEGYLWRQTEDGRGTGKITSEIGIAYLARDIADHFRRKGTFPFVLFQDDVLVHGQALNVHINRFADAVLSELGFDSQGEVRRELLEHVYVEVFIQNKGQLLIRTEVLRHLYAAQIMEMPKWRRMSEAIIRDVQDSPISNVTTSLSVFEEREKDKTLGLGDLEARMRLMKNGWDIVVCGARLDPKGQETTLYKMDIVAGAVAGIVHRSEHGGIIWYTPSVLHDYMTSAQMDQTFEFVRRGLSEKMPPEMQVHFDSFISEIESVKDIIFRAAVLDLVLSQIVMGQFLKDLGIQTELKDDLDKTGEFYGFQQSGIHWELIRDIRTLTLEAGQVQRIFGSLPGIREMQKKELPISGNVEVRRVDWDSSAFNRVSSQAIVYASDREKDLLLRLQKEEQANKQWPIRHRDIGNVGEETNSLSEFIHEFATGEQMKKRDIEWDVHQDARLDEWLASLYYLVDTERLNFTYCEKDGRAGTAVCSTEMTLSLIPAMLGENAYVFLNRLMEYSRIRGIPVDRLLDRTDIDKDPAYRNLASGLVRYLLRMVEENKRLSPVILGWRCPVVLSDGNQSAEG